MRLNIANALHWRDFPKPTIAQVQGYYSMGARCWPRFVI
jgi:hypothetical protein